MSGLYGGCLTGIDLLQGGKLTQAGKQAYIADVLSLLATGNAKGMAPALAPWGNLIGGLPPVPGPTIFNVTTLAEEPLFWFEPDPLATLMATYLTADDNCTTWNTIFPNGLLTTTAEALDLPGQTPLFPFFDASVLLPSIAVFPLSLPDLAVQLKIPLLPDLLIKLAGLNIQLTLPNIPAPPTLTLPNLDLEVVFALPKLTLGLLALPFKLLLQLVLPPNISIILDMIQFNFKAVFNLALNLLLELLTPLIPIVPKLLIASLLVWLKDIVSMVCVDIVGQLAGAGGFLTIGVGVATGLIPTTVLTDFQQGKSLPQ
jgi:hypothetical protein